MCSSDNLSRLKRMRRKIQNTSFFSSITKRVPALHSRPHHSLAHVNSPLNWQFKRVTRTTKLYKDSLDFLFSFTEGIRISY